MRPTGRSVDGQHAEPFEVVVGAVVELEAEADLANGRRADPDEGGPLERRAVDPHRPLEALEELANEGAAIIAEPSARRSSQVGARRARTLPVP